MERVTIKPVKGKIVRDPSGCRPVPETGVTIVLNTYWRKRLAEGSVEIVRPALKGAVKAASTSVSTTKEPAKGDK